MKKLIYIFNILLTMFVFASCKDENVFVSIEDEPFYSILVSIPDNSTRATYKEDGEDIAVVWEKGDVIKIGSNEFVFKEMQGTNGLFFHYGELTGYKTQATFGFPANGEGSQVQSKNNHCREVLEGSVPADYDFTPNAKDKGVIQLFPAQNMSLLHIQTKSPAMFLGGSLLEIKGLDKNYSVSLGEDPSLVFADKGDTLNVYVVVPSGKTISGTLKFYFYAYEDGYDVKQGDEFHYYMKCNTSISTNNKDVVKMSLPSRPTHAAVQFGLASGTKWATTNVGASKESEIGSYFAWGETATKTSYTAANSVTMDKTYSELKGSVLDYEFKLNTEYDAAFQNWGADWIMPTNDEAEELVRECTWSSTTKDGVRGYSVSKGNKSIFLPATGYMEGSSVGNASYAYYWISNLVNNNYQYLDKVAYSIYFNGSKGLSNGGIRFHGRTIRPILTSSKNKEFFTELEGMLPGEFSVSASKKVKFSQGNLQYQASSDTWRFAENQYDVVGLGNNNISSTYDGWIDLFGWGTSGWNSGAKAYQPWSTSKNAADYKVGNSATKSLTGDCVNADWGVYNRISNGGDEAGLWRILTGDESNYLINSRTNAAKLRTKATVNGVPGVLLFPDGWPTPTPSDISVEMNVKVRFKTNVYTAEQFEYLEFLGVVFLPAGGYRNEFITNQLGEGGSTNSYDGENITGSYWTSSRKDGLNAYCYVFKNKNDNSNKTFYDNVIVAKGNCALNGGCNVRLIHDK